MKKQKPKVLKSFGDLKTVLDTELVRGNFVYDKQGKPIFTPTEDGAWLMENDIKVKK